MIALKHTTPDGTSLCELSARSGDLYVTTHANHKRQTNLSPVGFENVIPASEWPQTHGLDRAATGIGRDCLIVGNNVYVLFCIFCFHRANWHSPATLTEVFLCFFLSCKAYARVYLAKMGHGPHSS